MTSRATRQIGVISDTHGLLRPQALTALRGCDPIIHAGDVGDESVLEGLRDIAPVFAVRGNIDKGAFAETLPETALVQVDDRLLYVLHDRDALDLDPQAAGFHAVIFGHSHRPLIEWKHGVLWFNPGSAGPRRFKLPATVGRLILSRGELGAQVIDLEDGGASARP
ncbi:MAG: metallophosphoesterase family protein [Hyphomicrobiales bacterium]